MNRKPPNPQQLLAWLNSHLPASAEPVHTVTTLASSTAYLSLLFKFSPSTNMQEAIIDPTEQFEAIHNFKLLAAALQKMGVQFAFSISKLAEGSRRYHLQLLRLFYNTFSEVKHLKEETAEARMQVSGNGRVIISAPQSPIHPVLSKQKKFEVTEEQLNELYEPKVILQPIDAAEAQKVQFQTKPQSSSFKISQELNQTPKVNCSKTLIPQQQCSNQQDTFAQKDKNNGTFLRYQNYQLSKILGKITFEYVNECQQAKKFRSQLQQIMKNFSKIFFRTGALSYIFTGFIGRFKKTQQDSIQQIQQFAETRETISMLCEDFYQSNEFIRMVLMAQANIKNKILIFTNLQQLWQLPQSNRTNFADNMIAQSHHRPLTPFFSIHRKALIIQQLQYINIKDYQPKITQWRQFNKISTSTGFLLKGLLGNRSINISDLIKQSKIYVKLNHLFDETKNHSRQQVRLRQFIRLMLELKHTCLVDQFMEIYEIIMENIAYLDHNSLKTQSDFFEATESIMVQLTNNGKKLNNYFMIQHELKDSLRYTIKLLKVTVFCLLAEKVQFNTNPYYNDYFDKKSIQKTQHCNQKNCLLITTIDNQNVNIMSSEEIISSYFISKRKQYTQSKKKTIAASIVKLTTNCIKDNLQRLKCQKQIEYILLNCESHKSAFSSLQYLFFGRNVILHSRNQPSFYDWTIEVSKSYQKARHSLRNFGLKQFIQSSFLRRILRFGYCIIENKFIILRLLPIIQQLPQISIKKNIFFSNIYHKLKTAKSSKTKRLVGKRCKKKKDKTKKTKRQSRQSFWSDHKTVLVGMQILYIYKKAKYQEQKHHRSKLNYCKGFLLDSTQEESTEIERKMPQQINKYSHLNDLFRKYNQAPQCLQDFRSIVKTMLQIKEKKFVSVFLKIYNIIVRQIAKTKLEDVRLYSIRFKLIDGIVQKVSKYGDILDRLLKDSYGLKEDSNETKSLLRVTVYCFLAEMHNFSINEFYSHVFDNKTVEIFGDKETQE